MLRFQEIVSVITNDGKNIVGILRGFDQTINLILEKSHERVFYLDKGVEKVPLGLYVIRGDNVSIVGELNEEEDDAIDYSKVRGEQLKPVKH